MLCYFLASDGLMLMYYLWRGAWFFLLLHDTLGQLFYHPIQRQQRCTLYSPSASLPACWGPDKSIEPPCPEDKHPSERAMCDLWWWGQCGHSQEKSDVDDGGWQPLIFVYLQYSETCWVLRTLSEFSLIFSEICIISFMSPISHQRWRSIDKQALTNSTNLVCAIQRLIAEFLHLS